MLGLGNSLVSGSPSAQLYSVVCDGTGDYISVGDDNALSFGDSSEDSALSISLWYKTSDVTNQPLITKTGNLTNKREWYLSFGSNDKIYFGLFDDSTNVGVYVYTAALTSTEDAWTHIAVTYDATEHPTGMKVYIDGTVVSVTAVDNASYVAMENTAYDVWIGGQQYSSASLNGNIDEVAIFGAELDANAVNVIYNSGEPFDLTSDRTTGVKVYDNASDLVGYWRMNEGSGTTITDSSGNGNNGTLTADAAFSTDTPDD